MNSLQIRAGEEFTLRTGEKMRIVKIEDGHCIVLCLKTGHSYIYGIDALKRVYLMETESEVKSDGSK